MTSLYDILKANRLGTDSDPWIAMLGEAWKASEEDYKEYMGLVPYTFIGNGQPLLDFLISGNMSQASGVPPTTPIQPQETGERTGNLFDMSTVENGKGIAMDGSITNYVRRCSTVTPIDVSTYGNVTLSFTATLSRTRVIYALFNDSVLIVRQTAIFSGTTIDVSSGNKLYICFYDTADTETIQKSDLSNVMFNTGSTPLPYEPYGYKLDISSASTTTPVYLGEVETTRKIKKLVLTGEEETDFYRKNITSADNSLYYIRFTALQSAPLNGSPLYCTHLQNLNYTPSEEPGIKVAATYNVIYFNLGLDIMNAQPSGNTVAGLKEYLAAQYAAGTPVTVWYVLAEPETGIVNEPIRKIGEYADTLSMEQAGVSIPTSNGSTTVDVETTLKPSEIYIKYKGR